jgi:hypothetical protein
VGTHKSARNKRYVIGGFGKETGEIGKIWGRKVQKKTTYQLGQTIKAYESSVIPEFSGTFQAEKLQM